MGDVKHTEKMSPESEKQGPEYGILRGFPWQIAVSLS